MGLLRHFFDCNNIDRKVKYWVYAAGPLNTLLWGCESWNLTQRNLKHLSSFHHKAIKRILSLKWERVKEEKITNEEVRRRFNNIPNIETYIIRRTSRYIGKVIRSEKNNIPWKLLGAWIFAPSRKIGRPQNSCNNNFLIAICALFQRWKKVANSRAGLPSLVRRVPGTTKSTTFSKKHKNPITRTKPNMQNLRFDNHELVKLLLLLLLLLRYCTVRTYVSGALFRFLSFSPHARRKATQQTTTNAYCTL